jgi:hypothetical protein
VSRRSCFDLSEPTCDTRSSSCTIMFNATKVSVTHLFTKGERWDYIPYRLVVLKSEKKLVTYVLLLFGKPHVPSHYQLHSSIMLVISFYGPNGTHYFVPSIFVCASLCFIIRLNMPITKQMTHH